MTYHVISFVYAKYRLLINLVVLLALDWHFTILKPLNLMGQPACLKEEEDF